MRGKLDELLTFWARPTIQWDLKCENIATANQTARQVLLQNIEGTLLDISPSDWIHEYGPDAILWVGYAIVSSTLIFCLYNTL